MTKNIRNRVLTVTSSFLVLGLFLITNVSAATVVGLGSASNFAVIAGSTITNTGSSVISGDLALSPGSSVTGFPPGVLNGTQQIANAIAVQAQNDLVTAYNNSVGQSTSATVPTELGGTVKTPGVYDSATGTFGITGTLTLDGQGDPNAVFIFKTTSTLITAGASQVVLINNAQACNVFWQVGTSATLGANSTFKGNLLVLSSATLTTGANVEGRVLARNGAVTLDTNNISRATCAPAVVVTTPPSATTTPVSTATTTPTQTSTTTTNTVVSVTTPPPVTPPAAVSVTPSNLGLPATGFGPFESKILFGLVASLGLIVLASVFFARVAKRREI